MNLKNPFAKVPTPTATEVLNALKARLNIANQNLAGGKADIATHKAAFDDAASRVENFETPEELAEAQRDMGARRKALRLSEVQLPALQAAVDSLMPEVERAEAPVIVEQLEIHQKEHRDLITALIAAMSPAGAAYQAMRDHHKKLVELYPSRFLLSDGREIPRHAGVLNFWLIMERAIEIDWAQFRFKLAERHPELLAIDDEQRVEADRRRMIPGPDLASHPPRGGMYGQIRISD